MAKPSWVTLSKSSGTGGGSVNVTCKANTGTSRSGSITVKTASGLTKTVSLSQAAYVSTFTIKWNVTLQNNTGSTIRLSSQTIRLSVNESYDSVQDIYILNSGAHVTLNNGGKQNLVNAVGITQDLQASTKSYTRFSYLIGGYRVYGSMLHLENNRSFDIDGSSGTYQDLGVSLQFNGGNTYNLTGTIPLVN